MQFVKMHGLGNDYLLVDGFAESLPPDLGELARRISHRRYGVGGDGLIVVGPSNAADASMRIFNADGSEAEMCGNGIRCAAKLFYDRGIVRRSPMTIATGAGVLTARLEFEGDRIFRVEVDMGAPILEAADIPTTLPGSPVVDAEFTIDDARLNVTCVSMGNPHCVVFVDRADDHCVLQWGPQIETDAHFPRHTNVEFVEVLSRNEVRQRTWERGVGETWACGTGACAVCVAGVLAGRTERKITVQLPGGRLDLHWREQDNHVYMAGPAEEVFVGQWPIE